VIGKKLLYGGRALHQHPGVQRGGSKRVSQPETLSTLFEYVFDYEMSPTKVKVQVMNSLLGGGKLLGVREAAVEAGAWLRCTAVRKLTRRLPRQRDRFRVADNYRTSSIRRIEMSPSKAVPPATIPTDVNRDGSRAPRTESGRKLLKGITVRCQVSSSGMGALKCLPWKACLLRPEVDVVLSRAATRLHGDRGVGRCVEEPALRQRESHLDKPAIVLQRHTSGHAEDRFIPFLNEPCVHAGSSPHHSIGERLPTGAYARLPGESKVIDEERIC
jgi:hypothetical protein